MLGGPLTSCGATLDLNRLGDESASASNSQSHFRKCMERCNYLTIELAQNLIIFIQSLEYQKIYDLGVWTPMSPNHLGNRARTGVFPRALEVLCV